MKKVCDVKKKHTYNKYDDDDGDDNNNDDDDYGVCVATNKILFIGHLNFYYINYHHLI